MQKTAETYLLQLKKNNAIRSGIRQTLPALSLVVALCVFWCLKLTGITMAGEAFCGLPEHIHGEECPLQTLICQLEEMPPHMHTEDCIFRELSCELEEIEPHSHSDDCLTRILICEEAETPGHTHSDSCIRRTLTCTEPEIPAHSHGSECHTRTLICPEPEIPGHSHGSSCYIRSLTCPQEESEDHTHSGECYTDTLNCSVPESAGHLHGDGCFETSLVCTREETPGHTHEDGCYTQEPGYFCGQEEHPAHSHEDGCYTTEEGNFCCGLEETEGHSHDTACYTFGIGFGCELTEAGGHIHTEDCITEQTHFGCGLEITTGHTHSESCYDIHETCPLEEHTHDVSCYSDLSADLETADDWEMTLAGLIPSTRTPENIVMVAQSQLGYTESIRNFEVDELGVRRGITRYGQWYGNPYGDWSAMFAAFCLHYAGVEDIPMNAGPEAMRIEWEQAQLYVSAAEFSPVRGHLLFLDKDASGAADAVAIITGFEDDQISVIEGDLQDAVAETDYPIDDPAILGYGTVPFAPELDTLMTGEGIPIALAVEYDPSMLICEDSFVFYVHTDSGPYAFDGNGNAVPVTIDQTGLIHTTLSEPDLLLWNFVASDADSYQIRNRVTGKLMHGSTGGIVPDSNPADVPDDAPVSSDGEATLRITPEYAPMSTTAGILQTTGGQTQAVQVGRASYCSVWLDGTLGGIMSMADSPNMRYSVLVGSTMVLPTEWDSPAKYSYTLQGWYDVTNNKYYAPGAEVVINGNTVFYPDWVASTYNIGQYNSLVADTVSTNDFITTHVFDYNALFNVLSSRATSSISESSHTETWRIITSGNNLYNGEPTLNYIFRDWDRGNEDITYPNGSTNQNTNGDVYTGLYSSRLRNALFNPNNAFDPKTGTGIIGKTYLGTADHLFQFESEPSNPNYGYYYYDSSLNAASYSQSANRFYVYNYLESTSDSAANNKYSDFMPLNSPYANTNGKNVPTYRYAGDRGEYNGTTHYMYDAKYNTNGSAASHVASNYFFGMSIDINFYLPNSPGTRDESGAYGNRDLYGNEMHFKFSGDDDVWVLVDGQLVLDIGGIHGIESGDINFSSGVATVNGTRTGTITNLAPGDHTLTILYLERGSSQSNCAIYFNLAPRFSFSIQKEDVLTQAVLNGAQFSVYTDKACTVPAQLWTSKASHDRGDPSTNVFTVTNGAANMWGMGAGNTYYIRETRPPDDADYSYSRGIICVAIDKQGMASYNVELLEEVNPDTGETEVSGGFTVHGFRIDEQTQNAYIIATNAPSWVEEFTSVHVQKKWADSVNHNSDIVTVYLTVTDPDGTVRQIREAQLGKENNWCHTWDNLPKSYQDGTPIQYGVQEVSIPGYMGTVEVIDPSEITSPPADPAPDSGGGGGSATTVSTFETGQTYLLGTRHGYLAASGNRLQLVSSETDALNSAAAQWVATVNSNGTVVLTNKSGQTLHYSNYTFAASSSPPSTKNLTFANNRLYCFIQHSGWSETQYPIDNSDVPNNIKYNGVLYTTNNASDALSFTVKKVGAPEPEEPEVPETPPDASNEDQAFRITNSPLDEETSVTVHKVWDYGFIAPGKDHEQLQVTVALLTNGVNSGRTVTLNLRNNWRGTFSGLPYKDSKGNVISYTVEERWNNNDWIPYYGEIEVVNGDPPTYTTTITNVYRRGTGAELPSTGSAARLAYILCGGSIMLTSLVYGIGLRRKRERGQK